jgi:hypothetical protein
MQSSRRHKLSSSRASFSEIEFHTECDAKVRTLRCDARKSIQVLACTDTAVKVTLELELLLIVLGIDLFGFDLIAASPRPYRRWVDDLDREVLESRLKALGRAELFPTRLCRLLHLSLGDSASREVILESQVA